MDPMIESLKIAAQQYGISELARETGHSRAHLHKIFSGQSSPTLDLLLTITRVLNFSLKLDRTETSASQVQAELADLGAPIAGRRGFRLKRDPIDVLISALSLGRTNPAINTILPIAIDKIISDSELQTLIKRSDSPYLGYLLELLKQLTRRERYDAALSNLCSLPNNNPEPLLLEDSPSDRKLALMKRVRNSAAAKWGFLTLDAETDIANRFNKWSSSAQDLR